MATVLDEFDDIATPDGVMRVHLYRPATTSAKRLPGIVLFSEIYQQTAPIRRSALHFASHGYLVAVPEVFHIHEAPGTVLAYDKEGTDKGNRYKYDTPLGTYDSDARAAVSYLLARSDSNGRIGAVGFCLGGHLAYRAALDPRVAATACFYATDIHSDSLGRGKQSDSLARMGEIRGDLMMVWGRQDPHVPEDGRAKIHARLRETSVRFTWHEFNAVHAFMRDEGPRYDPALATLGYALALHLFEATLRD